MDYQDSGNYSCIFHIGNCNFEITEGIKQYEKMCDEISQMFLVGSLSGISVLGDAIREYLPVNLILLFGFVNTGIMLLKMYFRKKFDYM